MSLLAWSAYNLRKKKKKSNVSIFVLWLSSSLYFGNSVRYINVNFKSRCFFCILFKIPLNRVDLILATQSKLLFEYNYLKLTTEGLSFQIHLCQTQVKLLAFSSHTTVDRKQQRCKCTMVYLKDSFIVSSTLFLFIHNIALLQGLVAITTSIEVENL